MKSSLIPKILVAFFSIVAIITMFFPWIIIEIPVAGSVYNARGISLIGLLPMILVIVTAILFIVSIQFNISRLQSILLASLNILALLIILHKVFLSNNDRILKLIKQASIINDSISALIDSCTRISDIIIVTIVALLASFVSAFFINDRH